MDQKYWDGISYFVVGCAPFYNYWIFPINKNLIHLEHLYICANCGKIYVDHPDSRDYGICSVYCGYEIRGISWRDFV